MRSALGGVFVALLPVVAIASCGSGEVNGGGTQEGAAGVSNGSTSGPTGSGSGGANTATGSGGTNSAIGSGGSNAATGSGGSSAPNTGGTGGGTGGAVTGAGGSATAGSNLDAGLADRTAPPMMDAAPSSGCGAASASGVSNGTVQARSKARTYVLSVPAGYASSKTYPLVFAWHGLGGSGQLARLYFGVEQQSAGQAIFVYPDALPLASQGNQPGWDLTPTGDDVAFFDALAAQLSSSLCVDKNRIFSIGHSFGGYMTNTLGCSRGDVLRAIAPVSGGGPYTPTCQGSVAAWLAHGSADTTVTIDVGIASRDHWVKANGCAATTTAVAPAPCAAYAGCKTDLPVVWCEHTGGHDWPSFAAAGIWNFLASFH
jgi:polyhydroxybutyrate depolymerase